MAKLDNVYLEQRVKDGLVSCRTSQGEYIVNTSYGNGYGLAFRNDKFVVIDIAGTEFEFNNIYGAGVFMSAAGSYDDRSRKEIYDRVKELTE